MNATSSPGGIVNSHDDGYEEYEPLQPISPDWKAEKTDKPPEEEIDELNDDIASHSGDQLEEQVIEELKSKISLSDKSIKMRESISDESEHLEVEADIHQDNDTKDNDSPTEHIALNQTGEASYLSLFNTQNGSVDGEDDVNLPEVLVMSPGSTSYFSLFDKDGQPFDVVMMSADDIAGIEEEINESNIEVSIPGMEEELKTNLNELVDVVVVSQDEVAAIMDEMGQSNVEVLNKIANETTNEEEKANVQMLLQWAKSKSGTMPKTYTMKAREARKMESFKKAVDVGARNIVIFEKEPTLESKVKNIEIEQKKNKDKLPTEQGITREFLEGAIAAYEKISSVSLLSMKFSKNRQLDVNVADIKSQLGGTGEAIQEKLYRWIIKEKTQQQKSSQIKDLNAFLIAQLGPMFAGYLSGFTKNKTKIAESTGRPGSIKRVNLSLPFHPIVYTDDKYEIFDDITGYENAPISDGLDLPHMKLALRSLAQLHAISFAYFAEVKDVTDVLDVLIDKCYQPSASKEVQKTEKTKLSQMFERLLQVIRSNKAEGGESVARKLESRFNSERIFNAYKEALTTPSKFSVVCHGFPTAQSFKFLYDKDNSDVPMGAEIVGFENARYVNAMTDVHILFGTSLGSEIQNRSDFLLRFVYHETLASTLKALKVNPKRIIEFEELQKEFKRTETFGKLAAAMHFAGIAEPKSMDMTTKKKETGTRRSFYSKILGGTIGGEQTIKEEVNVEEDKQGNILSPSIRAFNLIRSLI